MHMMGIKTRLKELIKFTDSWIADVHIDDDLPEPRTCTVTIKLKWLVRWFLKWYFIKNRYTNVREKIHSLMPIRVRVINVTVK